MVENLKQNLNFQNGKSLDESNGDTKGKHFLKVEQRRKRRSKNEAEGRSFVCDCGKAYLSAPALTNHKKTKHNADNGGIKRGRGRPRKNVKSY